MVWMHVVNHCLLRMLYITVILLDGLFCLCLEVRLVVVRTKISCNSKFQTIGGLFKDYVNEQTSGFKKEKVEADYQ